MDGKVQIASNAFLYPMPMVLFGAMTEGKPNYMAVAWVSRVNYEPPLIGVAISKRHHTAKGIQTHDQFGVSIPGRNLVAATDYVGMVSGHKVDKSKIFETFFGALPHAPLAADCPLNMACRVTETVDLPSNYFFIGEIVEVYSEERYLTDGMPDICKMEPFTLTMPDNRYWAVGDPIAQAWSVGKTFPAP
jgi:flavin reductase (DIM6/NTAB) family NADH-FMN oxidoreductase RutF